MENRPRPAWTTPGTAQTEEEKRADQAAEAPSNAQNAGPYSGWDAPDTKPMPGAELEALRAAAAEPGSGPGGRTPLETLPLPPDELARLSEMTRSRLAAEDALAGKSAPGGAGMSVVGGGAGMSAVGGGAGMSAVGGAPGRIERDTLDSARSQRSPGVASAPPGSGVMAMSGTRGPGSEAQRASRWLLPVAAVSFVSVIGVFLGIYLLRSGETAPAARVPSAVVESMAPGGTASATGSPVAPKTAESEARDALARLREGVAACARDTIGVLPGTSPAVPASLALLKSGAYASTPREWNTPVWTCTKFQQQEPQRFQIQWQSTKPSAEGMGVAWLDEDADGNADRAIGFRATLKEKGQVEMGAIELLDPMPPATSIPR